jgi:hypothetical protein
MEAPIEPREPVCRLHGRRGVNAKALSSYMGHSTITTTSIVPRAKQVRAGMHDPQEYVPISIKLMLPPLHVAV